MVEMKQTPYLIYLAVELHHFRRLHELLLERAAHPLPVSALSARQQLGISARPQQHRSRFHISVEEGRRRRRRKNPTYRMRSPYASSLMSLYAVQGLISSL